MKGNVCILIIDGESCENVVATQMKKKLSLPTKKHTDSYSLAWLNVWNEIKVTKRCLMQFTIGNHLREEVWCSIVLIDA